MRLNSHRCSCLHIATFVTALLVADLPGIRAAGLNPDGSCVEGELLVKFDGGPHGQAALKAKRTLNHEVKRDFDFIGWQHIRLPAGMTVEEGLARYRKLPNVLAAEPNYVGRLASGDSIVPPNDPLFNGQWALTKISASNAWDFTTGSTNVVVAVIDTGVNHNHEDLGANMWRNPGEIPGNGIDDDGNGYVDDIFGIDVVTPDSDPLDGATSTGFYHGTACAGVIGAVGNNNKGITGLNWTIRIMALRFLSSTDQYTSAGVIECYNYVVQMKRKGINIRATSNSYGTTATLSQAIYDALDALGNADIVNVFIAGNNSQNNDITPFNPANYPAPNFISVAATDQSDNLASFSSFGSTNVDLAAPGVDILLTSGSTTNAYYGVPGKSGTSYACPYVAGAVALLASVYPAASAAELKAAILNGVDLMPALTNKVLTHGRLNVGKSIRLGPPIVPLIGFQPANQRVILGSTATFHVTAIGGTAALHYQWQRNEADVHDGTNAFLEVSNATTNAAGGYSVVVSNSYGAITSAVAQLFVIVKAQIVQHPQSQTVLEGGTATFTVSAGGTPPLSFRWLWNDSTFTNGLIVNGSATSALTLTNIGITDGGVFSVAVTNLAGMDPSSNAVLVVLSDFDRDGMADEWELRHGFNTNLVADAAFDDDMDGMSNRDEYLAGTEPRDGQSVFKLSPIGLGATGFNFYFMAVSNRTYTVLFAPSLSATAWERLVDIEAQPSNRIETVTDPLTPQSQQFYRVITPRMP